MATIQAILNDVLLRYRHSYTNDQVLVWANEEQRELFETLEVDSVPFSFSLVGGQYLYPIPSGVEKDRIKVITVQINNSPEFVELPFVENDNNIFAAADDYWFTILEGNFYINTPGAPIDGRLVYIYLDTQPEDLSSSNLSVEPSVPVRYQELFKLGILVRIALARKDDNWASNFSVMRDDMLSDLAWKMQTQQPEFHSPVDAMPRRSRSRNGRKVQFVTINTGSSTVSHTWQDIANNPWYTL